ncbi:BNR repeat-containing protein [Pedobacter mucosus]|uniref:BNR repeat-containing protein n=1 Tax=Pedobacter mucosus TaxID=2895286 RepID=UPI001EE47325|nr:BNR repeat-containing protein [Pedobacter mucosus]UKT63684.1 BNR repeat-containing protein [Pedobacter mucosus]
MKVNNALVCILKSKLIFTILTFLSLCLSYLTGFSQDKNLSTVANNGWANNSVNTVIFRKNSLVTFQKTQYTAYYNEDQFVVLAKRKLGSDNWEVKVSQYKGDASDAHKSISIAIDGKGFLHLVWGQHNNNLNYAKGLVAGSLSVGEKTAMLSAKENKVSYPEFYKLANGDLLFFYRDGGSGNGNLMINRFDIKSQKWIRVQDGLIDGEGKRNAYWQTVVDEKGGIHISWVWRESPNVASNHDLCYAKSKDGGKTWQKSTGEKYRLPINAKNAEYAMQIPQNSELINQTSMFAKSTGEIFIASYWRDQDSEVPQYHIVYKNESQWSVNNLSFRKTPFSLSGVGTKRIPISRPQIVAWNQGKLQAAALIFRDEERGNKVSIALSKNILNKDWKVSDLTTESVGDWEPTYDTERWNKNKILNLFVQKVIQVDGEGKTNAGPSLIQVLEWKPDLKSF